MNVWGLLVVLHVTFCTLRTSQCVVNCHSCVFDQLPQLQLRMFVPAVPICCCHFYSTFCSLSNQSPSLPLDIANSNGVIVFAQIWVERSCVQARSRVSHSECRVLWSTMCFCFCGIPHRPLLLGVFHISRCCFLFPFSNVEKDSKTWVPIRVQKNPFFLKKAQPSGFWGFYWVLGFYWVFWTSRKK